MSLRQYTPRGNRRRGISSGAQRFLGTILAVAILLQVYYPFAHGQILHFVTIFGIYAGAFAMLLHAYYSFGLRYAFPYLIVTLAFSLLVEQVGVSSGWPFGNHSFDSHLGPYLYKVPLVIPFVWLMLAHPILVAARRVTQHWAFLYGGAVMMAWHLFIDTQMAIAHLVRWSFTGSHIPFNNVLPISNPVGWLFTGMLLIAILNFVLPKERRKQGAEFAAVDIFLGWTLVAGVIDNAFFLHRNQIAISAGAIYALVLAPYFLSRWLGKPGD